MRKYRITGNMTGNSMDAIDLVLTEFDGDKMCDICSFSKPYDKAMQVKIENLRTLVFDKTAEEALEQIEAKRYADAFALSGKKIVKVGIAFNVKDERNITEWVIR